eukprot:TRINITY_DN5381_c0_g1_i2.p1 TRINITY_DN5381_c0_g1~~TRINITY_DN5381_c0_g1_i2.p1  ORF type:complete len:379 (+),score=99.35 TRINITY_DN5381_c0_g1_i2:280-1416(+)
MDDDKRQIYDKFGTQGLYAANTSPAFAMIARISPVGFTLVVALLFALLTLIPILIIVRADFIVTWSWAATFVPVWILFAVILVVCILLGLARGPAPSDDSAEDRMERGATHSDELPKQRGALFPAQLFVATLLWLAFLILVVIRLDNVASVSAVSMAAVFAPLLCWLFVGLLLTVRSLRRSEFQLNKQANCDSYGLYVLRSVFGWLCRTIAIVLTILQVDQHIRVSWFAVLTPLIVYFTVTMVTGILSCCCCRPAPQAQPTDNEDEETMARQHVQPVLACGKGLLSMLCLIFICLLAAKLDSPMQLSFAVVCVPVFILLAVFALVGCCLSATLCCAKLIPTEMMDEHDQSAFEHSDATADAPTSYQQPAAIVPRIAMN